MQTPENTPLERSHLVTHLVTTIIRCVCPLRLAYFLICDKNRLGFILRLINKYITRYECINTYIPNKWRNLRNVCTADEYYVPGTICSHVVYTLGTELGLGL